MVRLGKARIHPGHAVSGGLGGGTRKSPSRKDDPGGNHGYTVGDYLLDRLALWGIGRIYGYPGDGILTSPAKETASTGLPKTTAQV
ncbi:hypothetical protein MishRS11D_43310 (plasmid) [Methylomagnum ishizawai]|nr:hypothetical protein MishRS11D_43310 [Methylomagnum ishizawai]